MNLFEKMYEEGEGPVISEDEYLSIFHENPTFYEKKAFVEMFRRKWKEDKGLCSLFEKRHLYKRALKGKKIEMKNLLKHNKRQEVKQ